MNTKDLSASIDKLNVNKETKDAILEIIDQKINNDMNTFSSELKRTEESLENKIDGIENSLENKISSIKWFLGIMIAILLAILAKSFI